jgi:hypothetical protein
MRELTKKQKRLLTEWFNENKDKVGLFFNLEDCPEFTSEFLEKLIEINDSEILVTNINRFISDLSMESI